MGASFIPHFWPFTAILSNRGWVIEVRNMFRWLPWFWWRLEILAVGRLPRLLNLLRQQGFGGVIDAIYFKLWHPLRQTPSRNRCYRLVENVNGFRMLVDASDRGIGRELRFFRIHEPLVTNLLGGVARPGVNVLDIGANIGYYTLLLSRLVGPSGEVLAVEPHPQNFHLLCHNLWLNAVQNVRVLRAAVAETSGEAQLSVSLASNWHTLAITPERTSETISVPTVTVDQLRDTWGRSIGILRMDTEGYEGHILRGAKITLHQDRPAIIVEVHPAFLGPTEGPRFLSQLMDLGYEARFLLLRGDDCPWRKGRQVVRECPLSRLVLNRELFRAREAFTLILEPVEFNPIVSWELPRLAEASPLLLGSNSKERAA